LLLYSNFLDSLARPHPNDTKSSAIDKARLAYKACLNQEQLNKVGTSELREELKVSVNMGFCNQLFSDLADGH
jgi:hypothetical protein